MSTWLLRIVCLLLTAALLSDPIVARAMATPSLTLPVVAAVDVQDIFTQQAIIPAILHVHNVISILTFQQIRLTTVLVFAVIAAGAWNPGLAQRLGGTDSSKQERSNAGRITTTYSVSQNPAAIQTFVQAFDGWLDQTLAGLSRQPGLSPTNRKDLRLFARSARSSLYLNNGTNPAAGVNFSQTSSINSSGITLNMGIVGPLLQSAAKGDAAARTRLLEMGIRSGAIIREGGGEAFFQFLDKSRDMVAERAPKSLQALEAIRAVIKIFGVCLTADPGQGDNAAIDLDFSQASEDKVDMRLQAMFDYSLFKTLVLQFGETRNVDLFLGIEIKEGGGAADMIARPKAYLDLYKEALKLGSVKFKNQFINALSPALADESLKDPIFARMLYDHAARLMYWEKIGYEEYLSFADAVHLDDAKINAIQKEYPQAEVQSVTNRMLALQRSVNGQVGLDRDLSLGRGILWTEVANNIYYEFKLIVRDQVHKGRMHPDPRTGGVNQNEANRRALDFLLTDPAYTHENDYRSPVIQQQHNPPTPGKGAITPMGGKFMAGLILRISEIVPFLARISSVIQIVVMLMARIPLAWYSQTRRSRMSLRLLQDA